MATTTLTIEQFNAALIKNIVTLTKYLKVDNLFLALMLKERILTESMTQRLLSYTTDTERATQLILLLRRRSLENMPEIFIKTLIEFEYDSIAKSLDSCLYDRCKKSTKVTGLADLF